MERRIIILTLLAAFWLIPRPEVACLVSDGTMAVDKTITDPLDKSCQAAFSYNPHPGQPNRIIFTDLSTGNYTVTFWDFGDGDHTHQPNPVHQYAQPGIYYVCLNISNNDTLNPCLSTYCDTIHVGIAPPPCNADFNSWPSPTDPLKWIFHNASTGNINQWIWDFGDGDSGSGQHIDHIYADTGIYEVCLLVSGPGCADSICDLIHVSSPGHHNLAGQIFTGPFPSAGALVQLFRKVNGQYMLDKVTVTDTFGVYWFFQALGGDYLIRARQLVNSPASSGYMPTYFTNSNHWFQASEIHLQSDFFGADIHLRPMPPNPNGNGQVSGQVVYSDGRPDSLSGPAAGIDILLLTPNGHPVGLTVSDSSGNFLFQQVNFGNLRVHAEITGITTIPAEFQLNQNNPSVNNILLEVQPMMVLPVRQPDPAAELIGQLFPNPSSEESYLEVGIAVPADLVIELCDASGRTIRRTEYFHPGGPKIYPVQAAGLDQGLYLVRLSLDDRFVTSRKLIRSRNTN